MSVDYPLLFSAAFIVISLCAALFRTHIILIAASINMTLCAIVLLLSILSTTNDNQSNGSMGIVLIGLSTLATMIFCGVAIFVYRSRGTVRVDDFRDLRG